MGAAKEFTLFLAITSIFLEQTSEKEHPNMKNFFKRSVKIWSIFKPYFVFHLKQLFHILILNFTDVYCHGNFDTWLDVFLTVHHELTIQGVTGGTVQTSGGCSLC